MKKVILILFFLVLGTNGAIAGNIDTYGIGAKAASLGGAFSAYADDVYAPYYNPAGLMQIKRMQFSAGGMVLDPDIETKDFSVPALGIGPTDISDSSHNLYPPNIGFAMPISDQLAFGVAAYAPFGVDLAWSKNLNKNPSGFSAFEAGIDRVAATPTMAFKLNDQWSFGVGVSLGTATNHAKLWSYDLYALGLAATGTPITTYEDLEMDDSFNWSANVGTMFKPSDTVSIGLTYRSRTNTDFDGDLKFKSLDAIELATLNGLIALGSGGALTGLTKTSFDVSMEGLDFPDQVQGGIRYAPNERLSIEADIVYTNWSIIEDEVLTIDDPQLRGALAALARVANPASTETGRKIVSPRNWHDTRQIKAGVEYKVSDMWTLRGGWFYDPTPIPDDTFDSLWADADKDTWAAGLGWHLGNWFVDGVFQYTLVEQNSRIIGGESVNLNDAFLGNEVKLEGEGEIFGYGLTVGYMF